MGSWTKMLISEAAYVAPIRTINSGLRGCTHLARVNLPGLSDAVIKAFPASADRSFFNEVAGGVLAHYAQIGSPPVGLIWLDRRILENLFPGVAFHIANDKILCVLVAPVTNEYGLLALGAWDTFGDSQVLRDHLSDWGGLPVCTAFDEWIGNIDRHANNVLVGAGMRMIPIDHSDCFLGPNWRAPEFEHSYVWSKIRFDEVIPFEKWKLPTRAATVHQAGRWAQVYAAAHADLAVLQGWLPAQDGIDWLRWIFERAEHTEDLLKHRFGMLQ